MVSKTCIYFGMEKVSSSFQGSLIEGFHSVCNKASLNFAQVVALERVMGAMTQTNALIAAMLD